MQDANATQVLLRSLNTWLYIIGYNSLGDWSCAGRLLLSHSVWRTGADSDSGRYSMGLSYSLKLAFFRPCLDPATTAPTFLSVHLFSETCHAETARLVASATVHFPFLRPPCAPALGWSRSASIPHSFTRPLSLIRLHAGRSPRSALSGERTPLHSKFLERCDLARQCACTDANGGWYKRPKLVLQDDKAESGRRANGLRCANSAVAGRYR